MADKPGLRLVEIDEAIQEPTTDRGRIAAGIREGRRREKADQAAANAKREGEHKGQIEGIKQAHAEEMDRAIRTHRGAARAMGAIYGAVAAAIGVSLFFATIINQQMEQAFDRAQEIAAASTLVGAATQRRDD